MIRLTRRPWHGAGVLFATLLTLAPPAPVRGQEPSAGMVAALGWADSVIAAAVAAATIPGAVLIVARHGRIIHERAWGAAQLYDFGMRRLERPEPMTTAHLFDVASVTKVMATTYAIMLLVDRGLVDLDAAVRTYLPDFRGPEKDRITVRDLLTHRSGLYRWKPTYYHAASPAESYAYIRDLPLESPLRSGRYYSDLNFMLAGYIVESVSGQSLDGFLQAELYHPLGLRSTRFLRRGQKPGTAVAATSHGNPYEYRMIADDDFGFEVDEDAAAFTGWRRYTLRGEVNDGNAWYTHGGVAGHAGLFSTARDLTTLLQLLLEDGTHDGKRIIGPNVVRTFLTPDTLTGNGVGWNMSRQPVDEGRREVQLFSHGGFTGTYVAGVPELGLAIVFLSNRQNVGMDAAGYYPDVARVYGPVMQRLVRAAAQ